MSTFFAQDSVYPAGCGCGLQHYNRGLGGFDANGNYVASGVQVGQNVWESGGFGSQVPSIDPNNNVDYSPSNGLSWNDVLKGSVPTGLSILRDIFGGPQPGTYIDRRSGTYYRMPEGTNTSVLPNLATGGNASLITLGVIAVAGFLAIRAMAK